MKYLLHIHKSFEDVKAFNILLFSCAFNDFVKRSYNMSHSSSPEIILNICEEY